MFHGSMNQWSETERDSKFIQTCRGPISSQLDVDTQSLQNIGGSAAAGNASISVLGHGDTTGSRDKRSGRADIEGVQPVTAGSARVKQWSSFGSNPSGSVSHCLGSSHDFNGRGPFAGKSGQQRSDVSGVALPIHDGTHANSHFIGGQILPLNHLFNRGQQCGMHDDGIPAERLSKGVGTVDLR